MSGNEKDSVPDSFPTAEAAAEFWGTHDLTDYEDLLEDIELRVDIQSEESLIALAPDVREALESKARRDGVSPQTLANLLLQRGLMGAK